MKTKILIAEDEPLMRERLLAMLRASWPQAQVIAAAENGNDAWDAFLEHEPQVVFLDIRMPGLSGLEVAERIDSAAHIVFVTAYDQYAVSAFEAGAVDYLLKPVDASRLEKAVLRLKEKLASPPAALQSILVQLKAAVPVPKAAKLTWIKATVGKQIKLIDVNEVLFFQSDTKYTRVVLVDHEAYIRTPIKDLVSELPDGQFWQIHRSVIVNVIAIAVAQRVDAERMEVVLRHQGVRLPVSRAFTHLFKE